MSVQLILTTVIRCVLTLMGPSLVPVTMDIHWTAMEEHAMVYEFHEYYHVQERCTLRPRLYTAHILILSHPSVQ